MDLWRWKCAILVQTRTLLSILVRSAVLTYEPAYQGRLMSERPQARDTGWQVGWLGGKWAFRNRPVPGDRQAGRRGTPCETRRVPKYPSVAAVRICNAGNACHEAVMTIRKGGPLPGWFV